MSAHETPISLVFWGHACFGVHRGDAPLLLIDPCDPAGLGGTPGPPSIPVEYPYAIATHGHSDHAAFHTQPQATRLHAPTEHDDLRIDAREAAHDEFGGRLRGGTTQMLDIRVAGRRIIHVGDLGERLNEDAIAWLSMPRPDALILPAGGYFTLGVDGATQLAAAVRARFTLFCHTRDDGLALPQLSDKRALRQRTRAWPSRTGDALSLDLPDAQEAPDATVAVWLTRPDGRPLDGERP